MVEKNMSDVNWGYICCLYGAKQPTVLARNINPKWLPNLDHDSSLRKPFAIHSGGPLGGNSWIWSSCWDLDLVWRESWQHRTVLYTYKDKLGQTYSRRSVSYIWRSPEWRARVEWWAKCKVIGRINCNKTFSTESSIGDILTRSQLLSKLNDEPGIPTKGPIIWKYGSVLHALKTSSSVGGFGSVSSFGVLSGVMWTCLLYRVYARVATVIVGISSSMLESSVPSVSSRDNALIAWCLIPALWTIAKSYFMRLSLQISAFSSLSPGSKYTVMSSDWL